MTTTVRGKQRSPGVYNMIANELKINPLAGTDPSDKAVKVASDRFEAARRAFQRTFC